MCVSLLWGFVMIVYALMGFSQICLLYDLKYTIYLFAIYLYLCLLCIYLLFIYICYLYICYSFIFAIHLYLLFIYLLFIYIYICCLFICYLYWIIYIYIYEVTKGLRMSTYFNWIAQKALLLAVWFLHALNKQEPAVSTSMTSISINSYIYIYIYYIINYIY